MGEILFHIIQGSNFLKAEPVGVDKDGKVFNETIKTILTPLWNAYHFFTLYANADGIKAEYNTSSDSLFGDYPGILMWEGLPSGV